MENIINFNYFNINYIQKLVFIENLNKQIYINYIIIYKIEIELKFLKFIFIYKKKLAKN